LRARWIEQWDGPLQAGERPDPDPGLLEVLVEVEACGIGLTVLNCIRGDLAGTTATLPRVPGHELVGRIVGRGPGVSRERMGERVAAYFYLVCGECQRCLEGREPLCERFGGFLGVHRDAGYAQRVVLPSLNAITLPEDIDPVLATAIPDAIATPVHVSGRAEVGPGQRVAVIAAGGGVGVHMVQVARAYGADVVGFDVDARKLAYLRNELEVEAIDSSDFGMTRLPSRWSGKADVVIDLLGREPSLAWASSVLAPGGKLVVLTTFPEVGFNVSPRDVVLAETSIVGSRYASREEVLAAAQLVVDGRVKPVVSRVTGPDGVDDVHAELRAGTLLGRGALAWA
jgi:propanol-preferring alcohol dehydrogenase